MVCLFFVYVFFTSVTFFFRSFNLLFLSFYINVFYHELILNMILLLIYRQKIFYLTFRVYLWPYFCPYFEHDKVNFFED